MSCLTAYLAGTLTATILIVPKACGVEASWSGTGSSLTMTALLGITLRCVAGKHSLIINHSGNSVPIASLFSTHSTKTLK